MILVDTSVWSETTRLVPDPGVVAWLRAHRHEAAISTITMGELLTGLALLPGGRRRDFLAIHVEGLIARARERSCSYDEQAARALPAIVTATKRIGRAVSKPADAMIAAIAASPGRMAVATRNTSDFADVGVELINPWDVWTVVTAPENAGWGLATYWGSRLDGSRQQTSRRGLARRPRKELASSTRHSRNGAE